MRAAAMRTGVFLERDEGLASGEWRLAVESAVIDLDAVIEPGKRLTVLDQSCTRAERNEMNVVTYLACALRAPCGASSASALRAADSLAACQRELTEPEC